MTTRRRFIKLGAAAGAGLFLPWRRGGSLFAQAHNLMDAALIPKYQLPLVIPPAMPRTAKLNRRGEKNIDYYEIAVRQFHQQILPSGMPQTKVWGYGSANHPGSFNYPSFTLEAKWKSPVRVKWINDLKDPMTDAFLPHLLAVDQTLHWANPPGRYTMRDMRGMDSAPYAGPVPIVTHVHGAHTTQESDGYPEAWYLPDASGIPSSYARTGTFYDAFKQSSPLGSGWAPGTAVFEYPNDQRATTLWYHDHTLGMTRLNVYAGPAGFYLLRGGPSDEVSGSLPGPGPALGDAAGMSYYEIPLAIQDRSFNDDGSLFYPDNRAFFEGLDPAQLQIPFIPDMSRNGMSDVSPIWNPEFFGNAMVVNGHTWPYLAVEQRRYRLRLLNGCNSRFLILKFDNDLPFWQIGTEGGFLPAPVELGQLLMAPAERADVIVDFGQLPAGTTITLLNLAPDGPFGGGIPGVDFDPADPETTGQVMQFRVVRSRGRDMSTPAYLLSLPAISPLPPDSQTRQVSLSEEESATVRAVEDGAGNIVLACNDPTALPFGPTAAKLGTLHPDGSGNPLMWEEAATETPFSGTTEVWEIHNFTEDAHPIHIHLVQFQVVNRESVEDGSVREPESWETGFKDTVIAYPDEITRVRAHFDVRGRFVWHCHIVEHEDNEMMRPYQVV